MTVKHLEYFAKEEYRDWFHRMSPRVVCFLDLFRFKWNRAVVISNAKGALGRNGEGTSQHYWEQFGEVRGIDVHPKRILTSDDARRAVETAKECGFTGIGFYPQWNSGPGLHLDVRDDRKMGDPAIWGGVLNGNGKQIYVSLEEAFLVMEGLNQ